jgi:hypothetical protein
LFAIAGPGPQVLNLTATLLAAVAAVLGAGVVRELTRRWAPAVVTGALIWVWPYAAVWNSTRELGFRPACLCCGLALFWCAARMGHRPRPWWVAGAFGLSLGLGWWASPEILYFALPIGIVGVVLAARAFRRHGGGEAATLGVTVGEIAVALVGTLIGAAPWLYTNVGTGFASLKPSQAGVTGGVGYVGRLGVFFSHVLPTQLGVQSLFTGKWVGGPVVGPMLFALMLVAIGLAIVLTAVWLWRRLPAAPLAVLALAVVLFPFIFAVIPGSYYWADARYGTYFGPLVVLLVVGVATAAARGGRIEGRHDKGGRGEGGRGEGGRRKAEPSSARLFVSAFMVVGATLLTAAGARASSGVPLTPSRFASGWGDPNAPARSVVAAMEAHHLDRAYGDYWTSYVLDVLAGDRLVVSPSPLDVNRRPQLAAAVAAARRPAWLFFSPSQASAAAWAFANSQPGPGPYDEQSFEALLRSRGDRYRVVHLGVLDAVIPDHPPGPPVTPGPPH